MATPISQLASIIQQLPPWALRQFNAWIAGPGKAVTMEARVAFAQQLLARAK